ncbi:MAG: hypothetical protein AAFN11_12385, partial [Chloroflexota bacterium]
DLQNQADFLVQSAVLALAAGADRIAAYKLYDQELAPGAESFGILSPPDASPRPAYYAWHTVTQHFDNITSATFQQTDNIDVVYVQHSNGQQSIVVWNRTDTPTTASISATDDKAYLLNAQGHEQLVRPENDSYTLSLAPARCEQGEGCFLGGAVAILVQPDSQFTVRDLTPDNPIDLNFD